MLEDHAQLARQRPRLSSGSPAESTWRPSIIGAVSRGWSSSVLHCQRPAFEEDAGLGRTRDGLPRQEHAQGVGTEPLEVNFVVQTLEDAEPRTTPTVVHQKLDAELRSVSAVTARAPLR